MSRLGQKLRDERWVIIRPYLTERATAMAANAKHPVYAFLVETWATRASVAAAFKAIYGIKPQRVNMINSPERRLMARGRVGHRPGFKKALVALKAGEKIDFV